MVAQRGSWEGITALLRVAQRARSGLVLQILPIASEEAAGPLAWPRVVVSRQKEHWADGWC